MLSPAQEKEAAPSERAALTSVLIVKEIEQVEARRRSRSEKRLMAPAILPVTHPFAAVAPQRGASTMIICRPSNLGSCSTLASVEVSLLTRSSN